MPDGRAMDADQTERAGLASRVVPADRLIEEVIARRSQPAAAMVKERPDRRRTQATFAAGRRKRHGRGRRQEGAGVPQPAGALIPPDDSVGWCGRRAGRDRSTPVAARRWRSVAPGRRSAASGGRRFRRPR